jgi:nucleotide-binding universal stress UspA family protein
MKKILIALDYGPPAQKIAETGYALAKAMSADVILLHVLSEPAYYFSPEYSAIMGFEGFNALSMAPSINSDELKKAAQSYLDKTKQHLHDENIQTIIIEGDFAASIVETAMEINADIIVMGSHGRRGFNKIIMGSVAEQVLHKSTIPLFIIPVKNVEEE